MLQRASFIVVVAGLFCAGLPGGAPAQENRSIALILDASGSMNAALGRGTRIEAAKEAVAAFLAELDPGTRIAYRAYGHQSPRERHDCEDTELMVGFAPAAANREAILDRTQAIRAQGYTPITKVIRLAAGDTAGEEGERVVVLISDGKETCEGDPCAAAKALAEADARLVVHTIGFNVDVAARYQLQCIAKVARGTYSDASDAAAGDDHDHHHAAEAGQAADQQSRPGTGPYGHRRRDRQGISQHERVPLDHRAPGRTL